jgi:hypothetical protein
METWAAYRYISSASIAIGVLGLFNGVLNNDKNVDLQIALYFFMTGILVGAVVVFVDYFLNLVTTDGDKEIVDKVYQHERLIFILWLLTSLASGGALGGMYFLIHNYDVSASYFFGIGTFILVIIFALILYQTYRIAIATRNEVDERRIKGTALQQRMKKK